MHLRKIMTRVPSEPCRAFAASGCVRAGPQLTSFETRSWDVCFLAWLLGKMFPEQNHCAFTAYEFAHRKAASGPNSLLAWPSLYGALLEMHCISETGEWQWCCGRLLQTRWDWKMCKASQNDISPAWGKHGGGRSIWGAIQYNGTSIWPCTSLGFMLILFRSWRQTTIRKSYMQCLNAHKAFEKRPAPSCETALWAPRWIACCVTGVLLHT